MKKVRKKAPFTGAPSGEENGNSKLTAEDVADMRWQYAEGFMSQIEIAKERGLSAAHVNRIINRKYWKDVT